MAREIVFYHEIHTMMYQKVTVKINEKNLIEMLSEEISEESMRELVQAYYLCKLAQGIAIEPKANYGDWNASIDDISHVYQYEEQIIKKISGRATKDDLEKQMKLIDELLALSESELNASTKVKEAFFKDCGF